MLFSQVVILYNYWIDALAHALFRLFPQYPILVRVMSIVFLMRDFFRTFTVKILSLCPCLFLVRPLNCQ